MTDTAAVSTHDTTLIKRRFVKLIREYGLHQDDLEFSDALWTDLLHRASPDGQKVRAGDLPLLEEALFWALAARKFQSRIARDGFIPSASPAPSSYSHAENESELQSTPPSSSTKNATPSTSTYEHEINTSDKTNDREPSTPSAPSVAKTLPHPLVESYAKAGERYRKLLKEIALRAEKARKESDDDESIDIAAAFLPLYKKTEGIIQEALRESAQREKELGLI